MTTCCAAINSLPCADTASVVRTGCKNLPFLTQPAIAESHEFGLVCSAACPNKASQRKWFHKLHLPMGWRAAAELRR
jgi:hypothetical protein